MNTIVKQQLSNNMIIDFPIGDKAKTVSCDYMDTCNFKCKPFKKITDENIKLGSYDETFIIINTDKIIQRIRDLFKEKFFYKKDRLISEINVVKNYPLIQINAALTVLINDQNEYLIDKFDRLGHLVNIEDYYLFQPIELNNENISLFDRMNPIDYKHDEINVRINTVEPTSVKIKPSTNISSSSGTTTTIISQKQPVNADTEHPGKKIIDVIKQKYNTATSTSTKLTRGEDDWYVYTGVLKNDNYFSKNIGINDEEYKQFIISHVLDYLVFEETEKVLNYIYFKKKELTDDVEKMIKSYYDDKMLENKGVIGIILAKNEKPFLLIKDNTSSRWKDGQQEDYTDLIPALKTLTIPTTSYNTYVGFIGMFKKEYNIFKVKNMEDKRSKGARCDQAGKSETINLLNTIIGETKYTSENTKKRNKIEFCIIQEMYMRYFDKINKNNKRWFLTPSEAIINKI
jgi:hypothetical protein